jgi:choline kinase
MKAIILAAGRGSRMSSETEAKPKCLVHFNEMPLIEHTIQKLSKRVSKDEIFIIGGYRSNLLEYLELKLINNSDWASTNIMGSLMKADEILEKEDALVVYSDIYFEETAVELAISSPVPSVLSLNNWLQIWSARFPDPLVDIEGFRTHSGRITQIGGRVERLTEVQGQFAGIFTVNPTTWRTLKSLPNFVHLDTTSALNQIISLGVNLTNIPYSGSWAEFDSISDIANQEKLH